MTKKKRTSESASDTNNPNTDKDKISATTTTNSAHTSGPAPTSASPSKNTEAETQQPTATSELPRGKQSAAVDAVLKQMDQDEKNLVGKGVDKLPASWAQYENVPWMIADEGAVKKHTLVEGKGDTVPVMHRCYVNIIGRLSDDSIFLDYSHEELDFMTGHAQVPKGLEMAVVSMKVGERVLLRIAPNYGYSRTRKPENVPIDAYLYLDVTVVRFEKERNLHEMNTEEKIYYCIKRRELGKELFSASKPRSALKQYEKALTVLETSMQKCEDRYLNDKNEQLILNYVNVATCHFQVKDYSKSVEFCNKALRLDPDHVKALYRRAVCERLLADWEDSLRDYNKVIMTCTDMAIVTKCQADIKIVRTELAKAEAKTKAKLRGLFNHDAARGLYEDKSDEPKEQVLTKPEIPPTMQTPTVDWRAAAARATPSSDPNQLGSQPSLLTRNDASSGHGHAHGPGEDHGHAHGDGAECQHEERKGPCHAVTSWFRSTCSRNKNKTE